MFLFPNLGVDFHCKKFFNLTFCEKSTFGLQRLFVCRFNFHNSTSGEDYMSRFSCAEPKAIEFDHSTTVARCPSYTSYLTFPTLDIPAL